MFPPSPTALSHKKNAVNSSKISGKKTYKAIAVASLSKRKMNKNGKSLDKKTYDLKSGIQQEINIEKKNNIKAGKVENSGVKEICLKRMKRDKVKNNRGIESTIKNKDINNDSEREEDKNNNCDINGRKSDTNNNVIRNNNETAKITNNINIGNFIINSGVIKEEDGNSNKNDKTDVKNIKELSPDQFVKPISSHFNPPKNYQTVLWLILFDASLYLVYNYAIKIQHDKAGNKLFYFISRSFGRVRELFTYLAVPLKIFNENYDNDICRLISIFTIIFVLWILTKKSLEKVRIFMGKFWK